MYKTAIETMTHRIAEILELCSPSIYLYSAHGQNHLKNAAGEWALNEKLCPCEHVLAKAVVIRSAPDKYKNNTDILNYSETISEDIQRYADILEKELKKHVLGSTPASAFR